MQQRGTLEHLARVCGMVSTGRVQDPREIAPSSALEIHHGRRSSAMIVLRRSRAAPPAGCRCSSRSALTLLVSLAASCYSTGTATSSTADDWDQPASV